MSKWDDMTQYNQGQADLREDLLSGELIEVAVEAFAVEWDRGIASGFRSDMSPDAFMEMCVRAALTAAIEEGK